MRKYELAIFCAAWFSLMFMAGRYYQEFKDTPAPLTAEEMKATGP